VDITTTFPVEVKKKRVALAGVLAMQPEVIIMMNLLQVLTPWNSGHYGI
jgi:ABC-type antimicrobial peptide transport system ATPase subunit